MNKITINPDNIKNIEENNTKEGVYTVRGVENEAAAIISFLGVVGSDQAIVDQEFSRVVLNDNIVAESYICNLPGSFLLSTKRIPLVMVTVKFKKPLYTYNLVTMYLSFDILAKIKSEKELVDNKLDGKFVIEMEVDGVRQDVDSEPITVFTSYNLVSDQLLKFLGSTDMFEVYSELISKYDEDRCKKFKEIMNDFKIPVATRRVKPQPQPTSTENKSHVVV